MGGTVEQYRRLLPAELTVEWDAADRPARRSTRDWAVDVLCIALGLGFTVLVTADLLGDRPPVVVTGFAGTPHWLIWTDFAVGVIAAAALWWRRRWPVHIAMLSQLIGLFSLAAAISWLIMLFTVAVHRRFAVTAVITVVTLAGNTAFSAIRPEQGTTFWESLAWNTLFLLIAVLWGMVVRSRRQLLMSLRDRAERAESEQQMRVAQARALERTRIAREMHDVLAHRISLLSLHAGALEISPDGSPADVAQAAGVIRASAHAALQDLRQVIGVLRETSSDATPERPQPTLRELTALADESREAGVRVHLQIGVQTAAEVPEGTGRTAYRIVQEGLTNARKHARGATVTVSVAGSAEDGLSITVTNPLPAGGSVAVIPGTGTGLIGLAERAALAGGRLTHGRTDSAFVLAAWLPWAS